MDTVGEGGEGMNWESSTEINILPCVRPLVESWWGGRWKGDSRGRGHVYTYDWFTLMDGRKQQKNTVKQLPSN